MRPDYHEEPRMVQTSDLNWARAAMHVFVTRAGRCATSADAPTSRSGAFSIGTDWHLTAYDGVNACVWLVQPVSPEVM
jgi:hypothetical protein